MSPVCRARSKCSSQRNIIQYLVIFQTTPWSVDPGSWTGCLICHGLYGSRRGEITDGSRVHRRHWRIRRRGGLFFFRWHFNPEHSSVVFSLDALRSKPSLLVLASNLVQLDEQRPSVKGATHAAVKLGDIFHNIPVNIYRFEAACHDALVARKSKLFRRPTKSRFAHAELFHILDQLEASIVGFELTLVLLPVVFKNNRWILDGATKRTKLTVEVSLRLSCSFVMRVCAITE